MSHTIVILSCKNIIGCAIQNYVTFFQETVEELLSGTLSAIFNPTFSTFLTQMHEVSDEPK
jgi:hypothetical protein